MINKELAIKKMALAFVKRGVNLQKGQPLVIKADIECVDLVREIVKVAYENGASYVEVNYSDPHATKYDYIYQSDEQLATIKEWVYDKNLASIEDGRAQMAILSPHPEAMKEVDANKMQIQQIAMTKNPKFMKIMNYSMANEGQWLVASYPNKDWAKKVFPDLNEDEAYEKLFDAILKTTRIDPNGDPLKAWDEHNANMAKRRDKLNELNLKSLHYKNSLGTDFTVDLIVNHIWAAGGEETTKGIYYNPNMPTEEVFTAPAKSGANGKVYASMPLFTSGKLVEGFWIEFKNGRVVNYGAEKELDTLKNVIETDEGSHYLGEVALVPYDSPIRNSGILFYETLFDENASCHLALGRAYPTCLKKGTDMSPEEQAKAQLNASNTHVDFMIGTKDLEITGITFDGKEVPVFKNGNFVF